MADGVATSMVKMSVDQSLYLRYYGKMGKVGYTNLRLSLLSYGVMLPTYNETTEHKYKLIIPTKLVRF